jgi:hypothetical protein
MLVGIQSKPAQKLEVGRLWELTSSVAVDEGVP